MIDYMRIPIDDDDDDDDDDSKTKAAFKNSDR